MNIDHVEKALEQEEQNQHQHQQQEQQEQQKQQEESTVSETTTTTATTTTSTTVLALLISPSTPSSTSTVSPTASSISKNSSTDEVEETTAEAEPVTQQQQQPEQCIEATEVPTENEEHHRQQQQQLRAEQQHELEQRRQDEDVHHNNSLARQVQCTPTEGHDVAGCMVASGTEQFNATMTLAAAPPDTTHLLSQCIPENVTTELGPLDVPRHVAKGDDGETAVDANLSDDDGMAVAASALESTALALSPKAPSLSSCSSSSSTASSPSVGEERRLPVVPEEETFAEDVPEDGRCMPTSQGQVDSNGCINDRYNNNNNNNNNKNDDDDDDKCSDGDFQLVGECKQPSTKVSNDGGDGKVAAMCDDGRTTGVVSLVVEAGVPTSAAVRVTEIALGQCDERRCATTETTAADGGEIVDRWTASQHLTVLVETNASVSSSVAQTEIVQTLPIETTDDHTTTVTRLGGIITTAAESDDGGESGVSVATTRTDPSCATAIVEGSSPSSSLSSATSTSGPVSSSSSSVFSSSSSESSPEVGVLAESQQAPNASGGPTDDTQPGVDNRSLCDSSSPKGHAITMAVGEGFTGAPSGGVPQAGSEAVRAGTTPPPNTRLLTLAEELSQAAAAAVAAVAPSLAVSAPQPAAVVDVLPKSAAGTVAAVASGRRSTSPILHSSLKKPNRMGVLTGAATAGTATAKGGESRRRVSFPKDAQLITGYLDPVIPWASISICETPELLELYRSSCKRHNTLPLKAVLDHLQSIDVTKGRVPCLSLKDQQLNYSGCEALEEIFKHVQYRCIDLSHSGLDDVTAGVMFDIIEYYEAATELDISDNLQMSSKTWTACINMIKKSQALNVLITRGPTISDYQATNLAKALNTSAIHTLKLEHCVLSQQPIASLCTMLKRNTVLRELWLAHNQLICEDAQQIANLLRTNFYIQLIDISNNRIGDKGVEHIVSAIVEQAVYFRDVQEKKRKGELNFSDLSSSLNNINSAKNYFPHRLRAASESVSSSSATEVELDASSPSSLTLTPPVTPPSTPALPSMESSTEQQMESANTSSTATVYTMQRSGNDETNPPPPSSSSPPTPPTPGAAPVAPSNVNLVEMSTKHSVSLQTTSDRKEGHSDTAVVVRPVAMTAEEEALMNSSSVGATPAVASMVVLVDGGVEDKRMSTTAETVQTDRSKSTTVVPQDDCVALLATLETHSESPVPQAPKKARLAKQDSVLSEFEATICTAMDTGETNSSSKRSEQAVPLSVTKETAPRPTLMEEDVSELCADYDDDGSNLRISEENLFVELGIPALCEDESSEPKSEAGDSSGEVFLPPPSKKDELQLRIEKTQQPTDEHQQQQLQQKQDITTTIVIQTQPGGSRERKSAISCSDLVVVRSELPSPQPPPSPQPAVKKDRTQSSSSDNIVVGKNVATPLHIVEVEIKDSVPLSRSLDSVGGGNGLDESDFESSSPFRTTAPTSFPNERSFSSESLNSETSIDSNDSKSSLKIHESKFAAKNGTLERQQQSNGNRDAHGSDQPATPSPSGLQVLVLWNNEMTRNSARHFQRLLEKTNTLDTLNVGSNQLCNSFVSNISSSLKTNTTLTNLGLQGAHLSDKGAKAMAEIIEFGGNASLQRIDLRHNNIQKAGLEALNEAMKSNKSITRIDLDDTPRRIKDTSLDGVGSEYSRLVNNIRAQCERNKNPPEPSEPISTSVRRARANYLSSRKISLTCQSIKTSPSAIADKQHLLDPNGGCKKSTGGRLRSPLPSPIPSPIASPVPSPSRNRFHVSRVTDAGATGSASSPSPSSTGSSPTLFFPSNSRFRVVTVAEPDLAAGSGKSANNPYRSSSTISLPMSKSSAGSATGTMTAATAAINRRPVCSSAPTLSSFHPSSPLSPLAAGGAGGGGGASPVMSVRVGVASQTPSPLLPPSYGSGSSGGSSTGSSTGNIHTFNTHILPSPLIATASGVFPGSSPTIIMPPTLVPVANASIPLGIPQTLPQQQQPPQPFVPMVHHQYPSNYHFITTFGPVSNTAIPLQPVQVQFQHQAVQHYPNLTEQSLNVVLQPQHQPLVQQTLPLTTTNLQQPQTTPTTPSYTTGKVRQPSAETHQHQHSSSNTSSTTLHDSVLSSTSIESPDLEVKRFMSGGALRDDSCCSSISSNSIDSIDNANFNTFNTSISSTDESFDLIVNSSPLVSNSKSASSAAQTVSKPHPEDECTLIQARGASSSVAALQPSGDVMKLHPEAPVNTISSSSMVQLNLTSSQESLYDVHDLSGSSNSSMSTSMGGGAMMGSIGAPSSKPVHPAAAVASVVPTPKTHAMLVSSNSNESTLTSVQNLDREPAVVKVANEAKPPRVRKTSWILGGSVGGGVGIGGGSSSNKHPDCSSSGGSTPTPGGGGSVYTPAIEKLLSLFNPSNLFSSSKSSASPPPPPSQPQSNESASGSAPPSRKESPMGGLFYWAHHGGSGNSTNNTSANTSPTTKKDDERSSLLKVNVSPETTLTPQQLQPLQNQAQAMAHLPPGANPSVNQQHSAEHMPPQLKVEMKENISPENTITNKLLLSASAAGATDASTAASAVAAMPPHAKVIFQLGGDYDESEDDIDTLTSKYGNHPSLGGSAVMTTTLPVTCTGTRAGGSGSNSLLGGGGSATSNSSGISIGSGTSTGELRVVSPSPSATSAQSGTSDTVVMVSHLGQLARDSLSMFKNPSLTSQDSISIRSMESLTEMAGSAGGAVDLQAKSNTAPVLTASAATASSSAASTLLLTDRHETH
uniref:Protein phosphatase 1 regulatory subunit 37 n=1 Tax=Anopheles dirus TaxID=7168 RepID=A0A182N5G6_9DIPT